MAIFDRLHHVCVAVDDLDAATRAYADLGLGPWHAFPSLAAFDLRVRDRDAYLRLRYAWTMLANVQLQLLDPGDGDTPQRDFVRDHGPGVFHLGFVVDDVDAAEAEAAALGLATFSRGRRADGSGFSYLDTYDRAGVVLEARRSRAGEDAAATAQAPPPGASPFLRLHYVCVAVRDLDAACAFYASVGIGPWHDVPPFADLVLLEGPDAAAFHALRYRWAALGDVQLQLVQPGAGSTPQGDFLAAHGEGVFHLGFSVDDLDGAEDAARAAGLGTILRGRRADGSGFTYLDTRERGLGVTLQVRRAPPPRRR